MSVDYLDIGILQENTRLDPTGRYYVGQSEMAGSKKLQYVTQEFQPQGSLSSALGSSTAQVDFRLEGNANGIDVIQDQILKLKIAETAGVNDAPILPIHFVIQQYQILVGSDIIDTIQSASMWFDMLLFDTEEQLASRAVTENFDASTLAAGAAQTKNTAVTYYLRLDNLLNRTKMLFSILRQEVTIRVFFQTNSGAQSSAGSIGTLALQECSLTIGGVRFAPAVKNALYRKYATATLAYRFYKHNEVNFSQALTSGSDVQVAVTSFKGRAAYFLFAIRAANSSISQYDNLVDCNYFRLQDQNSNTIGLVQYYSKLTRMHIMESAFPNLGTRANTEEFFVLPFADDPAAACKEGIASGNVTMAANMILTINGTATATQNLLMIAPEMSNLLISNGLLSAVSL